MTSLFRELTPAPMVSSASTTTTSRPARASALAIASPITPAPITRHSTEFTPASSPRRCRTNKSAAPRRTSSLTGGLSPEQAYAVRSYEYHAAVRYDDLTGYVVAVLGGEESCDATGFDGKPNRIPARLK